MRHASAADFEAHKKGVDAIREKGGSRDKSWKNSSDLSGANEVKEGGRWPANVLLEHSSSCRQVGMTEVAPHPQGPDRFQKTDGGDFSDAYGNQLASDAPEVLPEWACAEGCPVLALNEQSGDRPSTLTGRADPGASHKHPGTEMNPNSAFLGERTHLSRVYADGGGAARFFTQFEGEGTTKGRWPSNVVLEHAEGCTRLGTKKVKGITGGTKPPVRKSDVYSEFGGYQKVGSEQPAVKGYAVDGTEEVEAWECIDGCPVKALDNQSGTLKSGKDVNPTEGPVSGFFGQTMPYYSKEANYGDEGGASRFFSQFDGVPFKYVAKANRKEAGCGEFEVQHITVKPLSLMRWIVKLVTRKGGIVLDPYAGSGSTLHAAVLEEAHFIGMERDPENHAEAQKRLGIVLRKEQERLDEEASFEFSMGR